MVLYEGNRSELFPGVLASATIGRSMTIFAPNQPGDYILQTTMVQDGACWFEDVWPDILQEFPVRVTV